MKYGEGAGLEWKGRSEFLSGSLVYRCMSRGLISAAVQSSCGREGVGCGARENGWVVKDNCENGRMQS